jgi:uncharacterized protein YcbX
MVVDARGRFVTQREQALLALVTVDLFGDTLVLSAPSMPSLRVPVPDASARVEVIIWDDSVHALVASEEENRWISTFLGGEYRFVHMPDDSFRPLKRNVTGGVDHTSFADAFPFLLLSEASLEALNARMSVPVPMNRFRPNIVIRGTEAFEEDTWRVVRIGEVLFHIVKPSARCVIITTDQQTAIRSPEPLEVLARFRRSGSNVLFGQNAVAAGVGTVAIGDMIEVITTGPPPDFD